MKKRVFLSLMLCTLTVSFTACGDIRQEDNVREKQTAETETSTDTEATEEMSASEELLSSPNKSLKELFDQSNNKENTENEEKQSDSREESQKKETSKEEKGSLEEEKTTEAETKETSEKKEDKKTDQEELSEDWTDLQFMMDGTVISVPCTYKELNELGWEFHHYYEDCGDKELSAEHSDVYQLVNEAYEDHIVLTASAKNISEERMLMTDCPIYKIRIETEYKSDELDEAPEIILPGGVSLGAESEDITDAYGKYDSKSKNSKGGRTYTYRNRELDCEMTLETSEKTGLCSLTFWHYN